MTMYKTVNMKEYAKCINSTRNTVDIVTNLPHTPRGLYSRLLLLT